LISDNWIVKWGFLNLEKTEENKGLKIDDIIDILNKSENIFDIKFDKQKIIRKQSDGIWNLLEPISLSFKIPNRELEKSSLFVFSKDIDFGGEFNVLYNGRFYIIYRKIDTTKKIFRGEWKVREYLEKIINNSKKYSAVPIPPTPFREELFVNCSYDKDVQELTLQKIEGNTVNITLPTIDSTENFFLKLFHEMYSDIFLYSKILEYTNDLNQTQSSIDDIFNEIAKDCQLLQNLKFYQFYEVHKLKKKIKNNISEQFINISKHQNLLIEYNLYKNQSLTRISESQIFKNFLDDFKYVIQYDGCDFEFILNLINYSKDVIVAHEGNFNYIIGVILGGLLTIIA
jgi:hypothetical protein